MVSNVNFENNDLDFSEEEDDDNDDTDDCKDEISDDDDFKLRSPYFPTRQGYKYSR